MRIKVLLPYKENFSPVYAGAVSLFIKDTTLLSKYKKHIYVYGNTKYKKRYSLNYKNLKIEKSFFKSKSQDYINKFINDETTNPSNIIEIHNRPSYLKLLVNKKIKTSFVLYIHNDPLNMRDSKTVIERNFLINNSSLIVFNSEWIKLRFLRNINDKLIDHSKLIVIYQSSKKSKINYKNKKKYILFVGKLNTAKGYDIFGKAIIKILNKYHDWKGIVVGDEERESLTFNHKNLHILGFLPHNKVISLYKKSSIAVVCSRWNEPLGRTSLEASANACASIVSNRGGLPETITNGIILKKLNVVEVFKKIKLLIDNDKLRRKYQKNSYSNYKFTHEYISKLIDNYRDNLLNFPIKKGNSFTKKSLKILHVANFNERHDGRLFFVSVAQKLTNGFIRLGHSVLNYSDRDIVKLHRKPILMSRKNNFNNKLLNTVINYNPNLILIGHGDLIDASTLEKIKNFNCNIKISQWFEDPLIHDGPDYYRNKNKILNKLKFIDSSFITTSPDVLKFIPKNKPFYFLPIPVDKSVENLKLFEIKNPKYDVFFAMSHGVNRGILKSGKVDERENFLNQLVYKNPNIKFDLYGIYGKQPIWGYEHTKILSRSKMGLNLSRGNPIKYYTSNRIASLVGNGLLTFIDKKTEYNDFFTGKEVVFYSNLNDLSKKINFFSNNEKLRKSIAKKGWKKYHSKFNSTIVADYIISKTFGIKSNNKFIW